MTKSYDTLDELIEESAKKAEKAKEIVAKSQAKRLKDEHIWRRSYDKAHSKLWHHHCNSGDKKRCPH